MKHATLLLDSRPTQSEGDRIAYAFAMQHFDTDAFIWEISDSLPEETPVDIADQFNAQARDLSTEGCFMILRITEENEN